MSDLWIISAQKKEKRKGKLKSDGCEEVGGSGEKEKKKIQVMI